MDEPLVPHRPIYHGIDLERGFKLPYRWIYNLMEVEHRTLDTYIEMEGSTQYHPAVIVIGTSTDIVCEVNRWWATSMLGLCGAQFCDSQEPVPLPLISEMLDQMCEAQIFIKLTLGTPITISESQQATNTQPYSRHATASWNTEPCFLDQKSASHFPGIH